MMKSASQIEAEAADWLARRDADQSRKHDSQAFEEWLSASTAHRIAYLRLETAWTKADRLRALGRASSPNASNGQEASPLVGRHAAFRRHVGFVGGGLVTAMAAAWALFMFIGTSPQYVTPVGGFQRLPPLADGSMVELNTNTEIEVAYSASERRIELDRGEAYFTVARDTLRPFIVEAGSHRVIAVGTAFSVQHKGGSIEVVVTQGQVRIERRPIFRKSARPLVVSAGQIAEVDPNSPVVGLVADADYRSQLGWREGVLIFKDQPLREVIAEFNRYNEQQLVLADANVGAVAVGGTFRPTNLGGFTRLLKAGVGVEAVPAGDDRMVLRLARNK